MFNFRRDLGFQLLALYLLFIVPVILASLIFDQWLTQKIKTNIEAADLALARAIAQETNTFLENALLAVTQLGTYPAVIEADIPGMEELFAVFYTSRPDVNLIYRLDAQGTMLFHYPTSPVSTVGWDFSDRDYFQKAKVTHHALLSQGRISPTTQQPVATAVMPLWDTGGHFLGLVATNIKLETLSATLANIVTRHTSDEGFNVAILDHSGQVIAHADTSMLLQDLSKQLPEVSQAVLAGEAGTRVIKDEKEEEQLYSFVPIPSAGWGVIVNRPTALAFATVRVAHRGVLFTLGFFVIVGFFFWLALSRQVLMPLESLAMYSQKIGMDVPIPAKILQALEVYTQRDDQVGHLSRSLKRMEQAIQARLKELSTLLQTSTSVVSTLDLRVVLDRILEQVEKLMDTQMCAIVALDERSGVFRAQASRGLSKGYTEQINILPSEPHSVSMRAIREGKPIQISDIETDESFTALRERARAEGYRSILAVPLTTLHAPPAALLVYRKDPHVFSDGEINLISSFANHAAMAIENATLFSKSDMRLREQTRRLEALIQSLQDGLILEGLHGAILYYNKRMTQLVHLEGVDLSRWTITQFLEHLILQAEESQQAHLRQAIQSAIEGKGQQRVEFTMLREHKKHYFRLQFFDVTDPEGMTIGHGLILRDITRHREIERMKSSLISTVSHELRTPLAAIKGYTTTLLAEDVSWDAQSQREFLAIISQETDRLSQLVSDLLDISRIEAGNLPLQRKECTLEEIIERAVLNAHPSPGERLHISLAENIPLLYVDPPRIETVLRNLIENAAKYAGERSPIRVTAHVEEHNLIVRVEDEGPGIPPEEHTRIFNSFYRLENGLARRNPGAGLGLSICKGFIEAHGGAIWLEDRKKGACFAFSLPLKTPQELEEEYASFPSE